MQSLTVTEQPRDPSLASAREELIAVPSAQARVLSVPTDPVITTLSREFTHISMIVLRIQDGDGTIGYGCLWCNDPGEATVLVAMLRFIAPEVVGRPPSTIEALTRRVHRKIGFLGYKGVTVFGLSAFDVALHDALCRRHHASLSALAGRHRTRIPVYWSGLYLGRPVSVLKDEIDRAVDLGFHAIKARVGRETLEEDERAISALVEYMPPHMTLMLDSVGSWTPDQAIAASRRLAAYQPYWLEDPSVHHDYPGLKRIAEASTIPVATGENEYLRQGFEQLFPLRVPYLLADIQRVGGLLEWEAVAAEATARSRLLTPHVYPHIGIQLCAALPAESWLEYVAWWDTLMTYKLEIKDGHATLPEVQGVGIDFDEDALNAYAVSDWLPLPGT